MLTKKKLEQIHKNLKLNGFYFLKNKGLFDKKKLTRSLNIIKKKCISKFDIKEDLKNKVKNPLEITNYQRHLIGEYGIGETLRSNNFKQIINPIWSNDIYGLRDTFIKMIKIRNLLLSQDENFCVYGPQENLYSLTRIQYYPSGGGFMSSHKDIRAENVSRASEVDSYIQILLSLSKKNEDFKTGGGFIVKNGKRIIHDNKAELGDIVIYNGKITHGVETIDIDKNLNDDNKKLKGRFALFCNLYRTDFISKKKL